MSKESFTVKFRGVRGGYPMPGPTTVNAGGNTTCIEVRVGGHLIIVDAGTGIISLGQEMMAHYLATGEPMRATILITHTHHDHTQGFPFFLPARHAGGTLYIFGPKLLEENLQEVLARAMAPPVFPLGLEELDSCRWIQHIRQGDLIVLTDPAAPPQLLGLRDDQGHVPPDAVTVRIYYSYNHPKVGVLIFRISHQGRSVVVATDTEGYVSGDRRLVRFAQEADLLIHDAEYTPKEYKTYIDWGHSVYTDVLNLAFESGVKKVGLFHLNQERTDREMDKIVKTCGKIIADKGKKLECFAVGCDMTFEL